MEHDVADAPQHHDFPTNPLPTAGTTEDDAEPEPVDLTILAERALLGEVLHLAAAGQNPIPTLTRWGLRPHDFYRPYHQAAFRAMDSVSRTGRAPHPGLVLTQLPADQELESRVARDGLHLIELMEAAASRRSLPATARMVLEASIRRLIERWSIRIAQVAERHDEAAEVDVAAVTEHVRAAAAQIRGHQERLQALPRVPRTAALSAPPAPRRLLRETQTTAAAVRVELQLLASLIAYPVFIDQTVSSLDPHHLSPGLPRALYQVLLGLREADARIDLLTVAWQARLHGLTDADRVPALLAAGVPWPLELARRVHAHAIVDLTTDAAHLLKTIAYELRFTSHYMLELATGVLEQLLHHVTGYTRAYRPESMTMDHQLRVA
ncbi:DnaB-like helicase N-terminal domain-containing protein [Actinomadura sp. NPDC048955]|uniref:DnaB-like helicase N-terminal domain-containing protein n=1 Tax=Actinomadura sp. NPDC048955 TaxID=3158228 RepID=UPI0033ECA0E9